MCLSDQIKSTNMAKATEEKKERARIGLFQKQLSEAFRADRFEEMRKLVDENLEMVRTTTERGVITMTLRLAIQQRDEELISMLVDRLSMKRDFIELMIYKGDPAYNRRLFEAHIDTALLEPKDIKLFVDHGMTYLFRYLDGKFLHYPDPDHEKVSEVDKSSTLRRYALPDCDHYIQKITQVIESSPKNKTKSHVAVIDQIRTLATSTSSSYDVIIDGGNILHARNGQPNLEDLNRMITMLQSRGHSPIVIIHASHTDVSSRSRSDHAVAVRNIFETRKIPFIATPYGLNDDLFILLAYLMRECCSIVTRDTYTDHIDMFKNPQKNVSDDFGKYLAHDLVSFTVSDAYCQMHIPDATPKPYTSCIQVAGTRVYIPLISGSGSEFVEIRME
jgi:hypothetical protein